MKISQEDVILIKNLYLSKQYGAWRVLSELPDNGSKLGSVVASHCAVKVTTTACCVI